MYLQNYHMTRESKKRLIIRNTFTWKDKINDLHECWIQADQHVEDAEGERPVHGPNHAEHVDPAHHCQASEPRVDTAFHLAVDGRVDQPARGYLKV